MARHPTHCLLASLPLLALALTEGCSSSAPPASPPVAGPASAPPPAGTVTTAPPASPAMDAATLARLVAPIALFPDPLLAQVLAAATHPAQIDAEENMLVQNPGLNGAALQAALTPQNWDPAVKGLAGFPGVLRQMARSPGWTTALGQAYASDPAAVMAAVQTLRQQAIRHGHLQNTPQQTVITRTVTTQTRTEPQAVAPSYVEITPAQPDMVYVPNYNPAVVYGEDYGAYPGYVVESNTSWPGWTEGAIGFGAAIAVGTLLAHPWGWSHWGMHWGGPPPPGQPWQRPTVIYDQRHYDIHPSFQQNLHPNLQPHFYGAGFRPGGSAAVASPQSWQAPHFDPRWQTHHWTAGPAAARAPVDPNAWHVRSRPAWTPGAGQPQSAHPVSYIQHDAQPTPPADGLHASTRPAGRLGMAPAWQAPGQTWDRQPHATRPAEHRTAAWAPAGGDFHLNPRPAEMAYHPPRPMPAEHPHPAFQPASRSEPRPGHPPAPAHHGGGEHHR